MSLYENTVWLEQSLELAGDLAVRGKFYEARQVAICVRTVGYIRESNHILAVIREEQKKWWGEHGLCDMCGGTLDGSPDAAPTCDCGTKGE